MNITVSEVAIKNINAKTANRYALAGAFGNYSRISLVDKDGYKTIRMSLTLGQLGAPIEANAFESNRE